MIGYLGSETIEKLKSSGCVSCCYGTSTTPEHYGDLVAIYFFDENGVEIAHQTQMAGVCGIPELTFYRRKWGVENPAKYTRSQRFDNLLGQELLANRVYSIV